MNLEDKQRGFELATQAKALVSPVWINNKLVPNCVIPSATERFDPKATRGSTTRANHKTTMGGFSQLEEIRGPMYDYR